MKLGSKNLEWFFMVGLAVITLIEFLIFAGGMMSDQILTTLLVMVSLLILAGELIISIILLRMYDAILKKSR